MLVRHTGGYDKSFYFNIKSQSDSTRSFANVQIPYQDTYWIVTCSASASPAEPYRVGCAWWTPHYKIHEISPIKDFPDKFVQQQLEPTNQYETYKIKQLYMDYNGKPFPLMKGWTS